MIAGSLVVAMWLLVLGWTTEIVSVFVKDSARVCFFFFFLFFIFYFLFLFLFLFFLLDCVTQTLFTG